MRRPIKILGYNLTWSRSISFFVTTVLLGFLAKFGEDIYLCVKSINQSDINNIGKWIINILLLKIQINILTLILLLIISIPLFNLLYKKIFIKIISEEIFFENFSNYKEDWFLNYWESVNPQKTNRIEDNQMVFEASKGEWPHIESSGAYYEIRNGIYKGLNYEISCKVRSSENTSMKFKLWVHDTLGRDQKMEPLSAITPPNNFTTYKLTFIANSTNAIRIHLHCKEGNGSIIVKEVKVRKIK